MIFWRRKWQPTPVFLPGNSHGQMSLAGYSPWVHDKLLYSCPTLSDPMAVPCQGPLSMGFSRQEYWGVLPFPSPGNLPDLGIKPGSPALQADSLPTELWGKPTHKWLAIYHSLWPIPLSIIPSGFIHVVANGRLSFFFNAWVIFHCVVV